MTSFHPIHQQALRDNISEEEKVPLPLNIVVGTVGIGLSDATVQIAVPYEAMEKEETAVDCYEEVVYPLDPENIQEVVSCLAEIRHRLEKWHGITFQQAVLAVPPSWTFPQRHQLVFALAKAGWRSVRLISHLAAAALFQAHQSQSKRQCILVIDHAIKALGCFFCDGGIVEQFPTRFFLDVDRLEGSIDEAVIQVWKVNPPNDDDSDYPWTILSLDHSPEALNKGIIEFLPDASLLLGKLHPALGVLVQGYILTGQENVFTLVENAQVDIQIYARSGEQVDAQMMSGSWHTILSSDRAVPARRAVELLVRGPRRYLQLKMVGPDGMVHGSMRIGLPGPVAKGRAGYFMVTIDLDAAHQGWCEIKSIRNKVWLRRPLFGQSNGPEIPGKQNEPPDKSSAPVPGKDPSILSNEEIEVLLQGLDEGHVDLSGLDENHYDTLNSDATNLDADESDTDHPSENLEASISNEELLFKAIAENDLKLTKSLIREGVDINYRDSDGRTPLFNAVYGGDYFHGNFNRITEYLLQKGADPNVIDRFGYTSLMTCKHSPIAKRLKKYGAKGVDFTKIYYRNSEGAFLIFAKRKEQKVIRDKNRLIAYLQLQNGILTEKLYDKISDFEGKDWSTFFSQYRKEINKLKKKFTSWSK
ncbi:MAG: ankyrin repeat domain-containing protein [Magnetococcales bacterium]|nr:ankyrin repeat domain-containing protein [Magnetococcales bacterium]